MLGRTRAEVVDFSPPDIGYPPRQRMTKGFAIGVEEVLTQTVFGLV